MKWFAARSPEDYFAEVKVVSRKLVAQDHQRLRLEHDVVTNFLIERNKCLSDDGSPDLIGNVAAEIGRVGDQIDQHLLQLHAIGEDSWYIVGKSYIEHDALLPRRLPSQRDDVANNVVHAQFHRFRDTFAQKQPDPSRVPCKFEVA